MRAFPLLPAVMLTVALLTPPASAQEGTDPPRAQVESEEREIVEMLELLELFELLRDMEMVASLEDEQ